MLKIITVPDKVLSTPTKPINVIDEKIKKLIFEMGETLAAQTDPQGVGLAANQVGVDLSLFIIKKSPTANTQIFINPKIIKLEPSNQKPKTNSKTKTIKLKKQKRDPVKLEGCLSIPRIWGPVKRAPKILLEYQDLASTTSEVVRRWFQGFEATIIQHEMDHLQGVVFTQRSVEQNGPLYKEKDGELKAIEI
ncbi:MAG: Peptide deformylase [Candidatus Roizmanbacteria bacterium GW2011_GWA2_35_19]|uniref:Peptide deformylase n=1 Tax=Candidatus Roizmanbacteria bacterium GW2011_GWA2_35_19 TaxID=1618478 RepID=A0A0G0BMC9_9BACT|nr:MAG: Peptide deformylase [Candidatus Roizmanbacteria bacterium GW2011_GWA2_35_19]